MKNSSITKPSDTDSTDKEKQPEDQDNTPELKSRYDDPNYSPDGTDF
ncbi:MAG: hypothetical protein V1668_03550 [Patescibacteria group bacterium]